MKTDRTAEQAMVAFVACAGCAAGKERFAQCTSCAEALEIGFIRGECKDGCVGVGSCIASCSKGAMKIENGKIVMVTQNNDSWGTADELKFAYQENTTDTVEE